MNFSRDCGDLSSSIVGVRFSTELLPSRCESCFWKYIMMLLVLISGLQNEELIRKCCHQQLADAIAVVRGMYKVGLSAILGKTSFITSFISWKCIEWGSLWLPSLNYVNVKKFKPRDSFYKGLFEQN